MVPWIVSITWITVGILELIHASKPCPKGNGAFIRSKPTGLRLVLLMTLDKLEQIAWP